MRAVHFIMILLSILVGCKVDNRDEVDIMIDDARESLKQEGKRFNAENGQWDSLISNIHRTWEQDRNLAYRKIDLLILNNPQLDNFKVQDLHFTKGDLLAKDEKLLAALTEYSKSGTNFPTTLAARAGVYLKLGKYQECLADLKKAADINPEYLWHIGNYFEVLNKRDSAIFYYKKLYLADSINYKYSAKRIQDLQDKKVHLYTALVYPERKNIKIIWGEE